MQGLAVFVLIDVDGGRGGSASDDWPRSKSPVTDGEWHHIVAVKTKTHIHLYVDGIKVRLRKPIPQVLPLQHLSTLGT